MNDEAALRCVGLGRRLGDDGRWLYRDLDWSFAHGRVTAVVGPNGAGKSSLLRDLVGLTAPTRGHVALAGRPLAEWSPRRRAQRIGYLPQRPLVPEELTVHRLVGLGRVPHQGWWSPPSARDRDAIASALQMVDADAFADRRVGSLSGGELQRVMIARMLATRADILVLDEPTTALDLRHALHGLELLRVLAATGCAVVLSLHELEWARRYADDALVLTASGTCFRGAARQVLEPSRLQGVFGVELRATADGTLLASLPAAQRAEIERSVRAVKDGSG